MAVLVAHAEFDFELVAASFQVVGDPVQGGLIHGRVHQPRPGLETVRQFLRAVAQHGFPARR